MRSIRARAALIFVLAVLICPTKGWVQTVRETVITSRLMGARETVVSTERTFARGITRTVKVLLDIDALTAANPLTDVTLTVESFRDGLWQHKYSVRYEGHVWLDRTTGLQGTVIGLALGDDALPFLDGRNIRFTLSTETAVTAGVVVDTTE